MIGPGIEARFWRDFLHPSRQTLRPTEPPIQWVLSFFPGAKTAGTWSLKPTLIKCRVWRKSGVMPLLPLWVFMACSEVNFTSSGLQILVLPSCILLQMNRWVRLASTGGPVFNPTMPVVTPLIRERTVGPCKLMVAWTIWIVLHKFPSYVNSKFGRRQVNLRNTNRPNVTEIYGR